MPKFLVSYVYSIADAELKNQMVTGSCNMLTGKTDEDVSGFSIANFKKIVELYRPSRRSYRRSKTRKNIIKLCPSGKELNPLTNRCIKKCSSTQSRNNKGRCIKSKIAV